MPAQDSIGLAGPDYEMDIERGRIRDFARAIHAPLPVFTEGRNPVIPATFLITAAYSWGYSLERPRGSGFEKIDHDFSVPLHAEEEFIFVNSPPRAGDRLTCRASLESVRSKQGARGGELTFLTMLTEFRDASGTTVAEQRSTTVTTGQAPSDGGWDVDIPDYRPSYDSLEPDDPFAHVRPVAWDDLKEGGGPDPVNAGPLMLRDIVRFQGVEGEDNPLHYDSRWAEANGYPAVFGLGMHQASALAGLVAHWLPPDAVRVFRARFRNVYWPGEQMIYAAKVARKYRDEETGSRKADLVLACTRPPGDPVVDAWMTLDYGEG